MGRRVQQRRVGRAFQIGIGGDDSAARVQYIDLAVGLRGDLVDEPACGVLIGQQFGLVGHGLGDERRAHLKVAR